MKFRDMDELYSKGSVTIFDICDYFSERYGSLIEVLWDCQDWGILKSLVCTKKTGVEIIDRDEENKIVVIFYDKKRETVEEVERYLLSSKKYDKEVMEREEGVKIYKELLERRVNIDGLCHIRVKGDYVILDCFSKECIKNEDSLIYKIMQFEDCTHVDWETNMGIKMVSIEISRKCFSLILDLFN